MGFGAGSGGGISPDTVDANGTITLPVGQFVSSTNGPMIGSTAGPSVNIGGSGSGVITLASTLATFNFNDSPGGTTLLGITSNGIRTYKGIATISNGVPTEYATVDLTAQTAAIGATTLYAVPAAGAGMYRISFVAKVTTAATTSSTLGGAGGFQALYTDQNDSVVVTTGIVSNISGATLTGNTTQVVYAGTMIVNAKASTNIQYQFGYTSVGATPMAYNIHVKLEAM